MDLTLSSIEDATGLGIGTDIGIGADIGIGTDIGTDIGIDTGIGTSAYDGHDGHDGHDGIEDACADEFQTVGECSLEADTLGDSMYELGAEPMDSQETLEYRLMDPFPFPEDLAAGTTGSRAQLFGKWKESCAIFSRRTRAEVEKYKRKLAYQRMRQRQEREQEKVQYHNQHQDQDQDEDQDEEDDGDQDQHLGHGSTQELRQSQADDNFDILQQLPDASLSEKLDYEHERHNAAVELIQFQLAGQTQVGIRGVTPSLGDPLKRRGVPPLVRPGAGEFDCIVFECGAFDPTGVTGIVLRRTASNNGISASEKLEEELCRRHNAQKRELLRRTSQSKRSSFPSSAVAASAAAAAAATLAGRKRRRQRRDVLAASKDYDDTDEDSDASISDRDSNSNSSFDSDSDLDSNADARSVERLRHFESAIAGSLAAPLNEVVNGDDY